MAGDLRRPALRYHGGKWRLAPWIIGHFPAHQVYVEPFGGGASVLMRKERSFSECYNDLWGDVVNVFRVLRDSGPELARRVYLTPFSREEFEKTSIRCDDPIEMARKSIFRSMAGFGSASINGEYATGFRANSNRSNTSPPQDWRNYPTIVEHFTERLRGVVIENKPAIDVMQQQDTEHTLHYVDPPYVHETRNMRRGNAAYHVEMTDINHHELAGALRDLSGMVIISGYRSGMYDELYGDWHRVDRASLADGANKRIESIWINPAAAKYGQQRMDLDTPQHG